MAIKNGWIKSAKGDWIDLKQARFTADANPALNIDARAEGAAFYLATGGDTKNRNAKLRNTITREASGSQEPDDLRKTE
jgi:hypothetical protein